MKERQQSVDAKRREGWALSWIDGAARVTGILFGLPDWRASALGLLWVWMWAAPSFGCPELSETSRAVVGLVGGIRC